MLILLGIICLILTILLSIILSDIKRITTELHYLNKKNSNGDVTTNTNLPIIKRLVTECNINIKKNRKLAKEQFKQKKQIHRALTNITHDIKTPLTVATGYVQLMSEDFSNYNPKNLQRTKNNLDTVNYYLHYLMDFNIVQEESVKLNLTKVDISKTLKKELFQYFDSFNKKSIKMNMEISSNIFMQTDEEILKRIFQNLISNIIKYSDNCAKISLSNRDNNHVQVTFKNNSNVPLKNNQKLINRFYTLGTSKIPEGNGIGLNIIQSFVTILNGKLIIDTTDNWFTATLIFKTK